MTIKNKILNDYAENKIDRFFLRQFFKGCPNKIEELFEMLKNNESLYTAMDTLKHPNCKI